LGKPRATTTSHDTPLSPPSDSSPVHHSKCFTSPSTSKSQTEYKRDSDPPSDPYSGSEFKFGLGPGPPGWTETVDSSDIDVVSSDGDIDGVGDGAVDYSEMVTLRTNPHLRTTPLPTPCSWPFHGPGAPVGSSTTPLIVTTRRVVRGGPGGDYGHRTGYERVVVDYTVPDVGFDTGVRLDLRLGVTSGMSMKRAVDDVYGYGYARDRKRLQSWASLVDKSALEGIPAVERKRQEVDFSLVDVSS